MVKEFESYDVNFKIVSNKNENVYCEGYVTINDEEAEDVDWYFWDGSQYNSQVKVHHDGVKISGATIEQENEIAQFKSDWMEDGIWIDACILQSEYDENRTYVRKDITLIINDGAKIECAICEPATYRGDYVVELIPKYNGYSIRKEFVKYIEENNLCFDPYGVGEDEFSIENGHFYFEICKSYFEDDSEKLTALKPVIEDVQCIFQALLFSQIEFENDVFEQSLDSDLLEHDELFYLYLWANGELTAEQFADKNGYEW